MVIDTSALLAVAFDEPHAGWAMRQFESYRGRLLMSTVSLTESLIQLDDQRPPSAKELRNLFNTLEVRFISPDEEQAELAAVARDRFPLNLGDCFVYALAVVERCGIIAVDRDFRKCDVQVLLP